MIPPPPPRPDQPPDRPTAAGLPNGMSTADIVGGPSWSRLVGRRRATWSVWEGLGVFFVGDILIGQLLVAGLLLFAMGMPKISTGAAGGPELALAMGADLAFFATMALWLRMRIPEWRAILGFPPRERFLKELGIGAALGPVIYIGVVLISAVVLAPLMGVLTGKSVSTPQQIASDLSAGAKVLTVLVSVVVAPVTEELFFRGVIFRSVRDRHGFWLGAGVSSVLFGLAHFVGGPLQDAVLLQVTMVFTGLGLAFLYEWRGNILANIGAHMAFNTIGVILILASNATR